MSERYKHLEGSFPVNGDVTPITHQPIQKINSDNWENMSISELFDQREFLLYRLNLARTMGNASIIVQLELGLGMLDLLLSERSQNNQEMFLL